MGQVAVAAIVLAGLALVGGCAGTVAEQSREDVVNVTVRPAEVATIIVFTTRMEELARFYADGLQLPEYERLPGHMGQQVGAVWFGFDQVAEPLGTPPAAVSAWFEVDDLDGTNRRVLDLGAKSRYAPVTRPWGARLAAVYDLDGNVIGLSQRMR